MQSPCHSQALAPDAGAQAPFLHAVTRSRLLCRPSHESFVVSYLRYDQYLASGLPISNGVIEGACRHLIKDRMDITGACWGLERPRPC
jgi:hypothetical protein